MTTATVVSMVDLAPTFLSVAGASVPAAMDGQNVLPSLVAAGDSLDAGQHHSGARTILLEFHGESMPHSPGAPCTGEGKHHWGPGVAAYIEGSFVDPSFPLVLVLLSVGLVVLAWLSWLLSLLSPCPRDRLSCR